ncbi:NYN domain-containing protein [Zoogloea sp.]|uniref:NYN domain-containing protein n=1 Tax=Zoogloea sp. TaxID=49181 RepID=UPI00322047F4
MTIGLFIDGSYMYRVFPGQVDYVKFRSEIEKHLNDSIDEAYFFNADDDPPNAKKFNNFLTVPPPKGPGFRVKIYWLSKKKLKWPNKFGGQPVMHPDVPDLQYELISQKAVDVGLAFHLVASYYRRKWDKLVLVAGDGDFHEPIQSLVEGQNVELHIVGKNGSVSGELLPYGKLIEIDQEPWLSSISRAVQTK